MSQPVAQLSEYLHLHGYSLQQPIQSLWSGYGDIARYRQLSHNASIVVKQVHLPEQVFHPRGWHSQIAHNRKLNSYRVERAFYQQLAPLLNRACRVAKLHGCFGDLPHLALVLEDLDAAGFSKRLPSTITPDIKLKDIKCCLSWLAHFHSYGIKWRQQSSERVEASFSGLQGLWDIGGYWHLETRPDEYSAMSDGPLKDAAKWIAQQLTGSQYQTIIHGDAKVANFCFHRSEDAVASVDFQYTGAGIGVQDVMYLFTSCLDEQRLFTHHDSLLSYYFACLADALSIQQVRVDRQQLEQNWRELYPLCWADFYRFLLGWSPQHPKINGFMKQMTTHALTRHNG